MSHRHRLGHAAIIVSVALTHGVCSSPGDYSDPCMPKKARSSRSTALMGSLSLLVIKGPAHILQGTGSFPGLLRPWGWEAGWGEGMQFKNAQTKNYTTNLISETSAPVHRVFCSLLFLPIPICMCLVFAVAHCKNKLLSRQAHHPWS